MKKEYGKVILLILILLLLDQGLKIGLPKEGLELIPRSIKNYICTKYGGSF